MLIIIKIICKTYLSKIRKGGLSGGDIFSPQKSKMKNKEIYKCGYKQCKLGGEVKKDIAVKKGNRYYHSECLQEIYNKEQIRELFLKHINPTEIISLLNRTINQIIDVKKVSGEFLLYALEYVIKNKLPLNHAVGLYYIINNKHIKNDYMKQKAKEIDNKIRNKNAQSNDEVKFNLSIQDNTWKRIIER